MSDKNIHQRMLEITKACDSIPKNGYNSYSKYKYVKAVDVVGNIQKLLVKNGVTLTISEKCLTRNKIDKASNNGYNIHSEVTCEAVFTNVDKPDEQIKIDYYGVASDTLDKDIYKAKTGGLKYLLSQTFLITTDDFIDPEDDSKEVKQPKKTNSNVATPEQRKYAAGLMTKKGFTPEQAKIWLGDNFQRSKLAELSGAEVSKAIKLLISNVV